MRILPKRFSRNDRGKKITGFFTQSKVDAVLIQSLEEVFDEPCKWLIL